MKHIQNNLFFSSIYSNKNNFEEYSQLKQLRAIKDNPSPQDVWGMDTKMM
jgi:hypothetical protein